MLKMKKRKKKHISRLETPCFNIIKSTSCLLKDNETYLIMAYMYVGKEEAGFSQHRWEGMIVSKEDLEKILKNLEEHFGEEWKWPGIENFQMKYNGTIFCRQGHKWFLNRMKEAKPWREFYQGLKVHQKNRWPIDDYILDDGKTPFELTDDEDLILSLKGRRFSRVKEKKEPMFSKVLPPKIY